MNAYRFGLIGRNISRSRSPELFRKYNPGSECSYELIDADHFKEALDFVLKNGFRAVNVTSPFKDEAFGNSTEHDRISLLTRTSNLLYFGNGGIKSFNTDYFGVRDTIQESIVSGHRIRKVLVLGCGGAGKAAILASRDMGLETFAANRNQEKMLSVLARYRQVDESRQPSGRLSAVDFDFIDTGEYDMLISTLSETPEQIKNKILRLKKKIILEAEYRNPQLSQCIDSQYVPGTVWLKNQAIPSYRIFFGDF